jgi:hypothetical protein
LGDFFEALHQFENFPRQALVATGVILTISITAEVCQIAGKAIVRRSKTPRHGDEWLHGMLRQMTAPVPAAVRKKCSRTRAQS